jgi:hypothetical protein
VNGVELPDETERAGRQDGRRVRDEVVLGHRRVLAVVAHPDDESFGLGAVLSTFSGSGAETSVLCFTHGEASTLHGVLGDLGALRERELREAAAVLEVAAVRLLDHPDGQLESVSLDTLVTELLGMADAVAADLLLVFDEGASAGTRTIGAPPRPRAAPAACGIFPSPPGPSLTGWLGPSMRSSGRPSRDVQLERWTSVSR